MCPFDRQATPIGRSGVWGLKKNFALLELLERLQPTNNTDSDINFTTYFRTELMEREEQVNIILYWVDNNFLEKINLICILV